jgi:hypothetical protein
MRYFILVFLFTFYFYRGFAQEFNGGVNAGLSTSEISGDYITGPSKAGLFAGVFTNLYVSAKSSLELELNYVQKGSRKNPDSTDFTKYLLRLHYIELQFLYKYDLKKLTFEAGPSLGYLMHSYEYYENGYSYYEQTDEGFNPLDFSFALGLSYAFTEKLQFNIRYSNTLFFPVTDRPSGNTYFLRQGQYNEVLSFTLHYTFFNSKR